MSTQTMKLCVPRNQTGSVLMIICRGFCVLAFLATFLAVPVSGQMGSYVIYSDLWIDDSNAQTPVIVACGVTQDSSNSYGHTYWVVTTLTSPSGRTSSSESAHTNASNAYATVETSLPWDWNSVDPGDYYVTSSHMMCCPYAGPPGSGGSCFNGGGSGTSVSISFKKSGWRVVGDTLTTCLIVATCSGTCVSIGESHELIKDPPGASCSAGGIYVQVNELYVAGVCFHVTRYGFNQPFPGSCD